MISPKEFFDPCAWVWFGLLAAAAWNFRRRARKAAWLLAGLAVLLSLVGPRAAAGRQGAKLLAGTRPGGQSAGLRRGTGGGDVRRRAERVGA